MHLLVVEVASICKFYMQRSSKSYRSSDVKILELRLKLVHDFTNLLQLHRINGFVECFHDWTHILCNLKKKHILKKIWILFLKYRKRKSKECNSKNAGATFFLRNLFFSNAPYFYVFVQNCEWKYEWGIWNVSLMSNILL